MEQLEDVTVEAEPESQTATKQLNETSLFADFFNQRTTIVCCDSDIAASQEVAKLLSLPSVKCNTLEYWLDGKLLLSLCKVALTVLAIPATPAFVERVFSVSGFLIKPKRNRLTADHLSKLVFLKCNE